MKMISPILALGFVAAVSTTAIAQDSFGGQPQQPAQQQPAPQQQTQQQPQQQPQAQPQRRQPAPAPQSNYGAPQQNQQSFGQGSKFAQVTQLEEQDYGVAPKAQLHTGAMHGPTPTTIPGGLVITTEALYMTLQQNPQGIAIFDVLGGQEILPGALAAAPASAPGSFNDQTQQEFGGFLQQVTGGNKQLPLLFYCQSTQCWMSYNAALRAINMGYTQVLWYRGGIEAWKMAGLPTQNPYANNGGNPY